MIRPVKWLLDLIYPPKCVICGKLLAPDETDVCKACVIDLPVNAAPVEPGEFYSACCAPFRYEGTLRASVLRFKFGGRVNYARFYADYLAASVQSQLSGEFDLITWVPISELRRMERGFDQTRLIARELGKRLGMTPIRTLRKFKHNQRQSRMADVSARRGNVKGVYRVVRKERFAGKRVLLIDDIVTTGATLSECSYMLRLGGAKRVVAAAVAKAGNYT